MQMNTLRLDLLQIVHYIGYIPPVDLAIRVVALNLLTMTFENDYPIGPEKARFLFFSFFRSNGHYASRFDWV